MPPSPCTPPSALMLPSTSSGCMCALRCRIGARRRNRMRRTLDEACTMHVCLTSTHKTDVEQGLYAYSQTMVYTILCIPNRFWGTKNGHSGTRPVQCMLTAIPWFTQFFASQTVSGVQRTAIQEQCMLTAIPWFTQFFATQVHLGYKQWPIQSQTTFLHLRIFLDVCIHCARVQCIHCSAYTAHTVHTLHTQCIHCARVGGHRRRYA